MMKAFKPGQFAQQLVDFQKTAFENSYNAMLMVQGQMEKMTETFFSNNKLFPEESMKVVQEWLAAFKKAQEEFKKNVDENFKKFESYMAESSKKMEEAAAKKSK